MYQDITNFFFVLGLGSCLISLRHEVYDHSPLRRCSHRGCVFAWRRPASGPFRPLPAHGRPSSFCQSLASRRTVLDGQQPLHWHAWHSCVHLPRPQGHGSSNGPPRPIFLRRNWNGHLGRLHRQEGGLRQLVWHPRVDLGPRPCQLYADHGAGRSTIDALQRCIGAVVLWPRLCLERPFLSPNFPSLPLHEQRVLRGP